MNSTPTPSTVPRQLYVLSALVATVLTASCGTTGSKSSSDAPAPAPAGQTAAAPAASGKSKAGMDAAGNVIDSSKVESGSGKAVKGINDWEGEITGNPAPGSKFTKLQIGMGMRQAMDIAGPPTDQGAYVTGKAFIPWYFGSDKHRYELTYKGMGRLIFASSAGFGGGNGNLVWIIHSANESGYR